MTTINSLLKLKNNNERCAHLTPCDGACALTNMPHAIHGCNNPRCDKCHGGKTHADALAARRRAAAERASVAAMAGSMEGYDG